MALPRTDGNELNPGDHEYLHLEPYDDDKKLKTALWIDSGEQIRCSYYDMRDLENIQKIGEVTVDNSGRSCLDDYM